MSSENTRTGRLGAIGVGGVAVARTTQWSVNQALANTSEWGDSDSCGYTNRAAGRRDCTFSCEGKFDTVSAGNAFDLFEPEDVVEAVLYTLKTSVSGDYWYFPRALNTSFSLVVNIDTEEVIGWTAEFGADGVFYTPSNASGSAPSALSDAC